MKNRLIIAFLLILCTTDFLISQDSTHVFKSPRSLMESSIALKEYNNIAGLGLFMTNVGFGGEGFYQKPIGGRILFDFTISFSGLRNSDEQKIRVLDTQTGDIFYLVPDKVNRLYRMPVTVGVKYHLFKKLLGDNFRPFIGAGIGGTVIMQLPYEEFENEFFNSINYAKFHVKPTFYGEVEFNIMDKGQTKTSINLRYYYTPFGGEGIESIRDLPIENCGGIYIGIRFGFAWE